MGLPVTGRRHGHAPIKVGVTHAAACPPPMTLLVTPTKSAYRRMGRSKGDDANELRPNVSTCSIRGRRAASRWPCHGGMALDQARVLTREKGGSKPPLGPSRRR